MIIIDKHGKENNWWFSKDDSITERELKICSKICSLKKCNFTFADFFSSQVSQPFIHLLHHNFMIFLVVMLTLKIRKTLREDCFRKKCQNNFTAHRVQLHCRLLHRQHRPFHQTPKIWWILPRCVLRCNQWLCYHPSWTIWWLGSLGSWCLPIR